MNVLSKLTIKSLKLNKKRTIVTIIGIMLSVALITAVSTIYTSGIDTLIEYEKDRQGDFHVAYFDVPISDVSIFENNRSIETVNITKNIGYAKIDSKNEDKPYAYIKAFTKSSLENLSVRLEEGRLPENENEIVIPTHLKTNGRLELKVGETITLEVGKRVDGENYELTQENSYSIENNENIIDTTTKTYTIVGIIERPATNIESYSAPGYTFITYIDEEELSGNVDVYAKFTNNSLNDIYKITANVLEIDETLLEKYYSGNYTDEEFQTVLEEVDKAKYKFSSNDYLIDLQTNPLGFGESSSGIQSFGTVALIVIGIIIFTSIFCIRNSFDISITEKTKQYGMLRSIGATKKQIRKNVFYEASILGAIGIPVGVILGIVASIILIIVSNYYLGDMLTDGLKLQFSISYIAILFAIILGIITIYFSAFKSANRASKISPIDSIRNSANIKISSKKIKAPKIIKKIFGIGGEISYKNLKRNKKKYRTTVISIIVSVFVFIALSSFMTMAFDTIEHELKLSETNISLSATYDTDEEYEKIVKTTQFDNIENYTIVRNSEIESKECNYSEDYMEWLNIGLDENSESSTTIMIIALGNEQYNKYIKSLGLDYNEVKDKGILYDYSEIYHYNQETEEFESKYMRVYNLEKGDVIRAKTDNYEEYEIEISLVTDKIPFALKYYGSDYLIISDELFDKIASVKKVQIYYKSSNANILQDEIEEYLQDGDYSINNSEENGKTMNSLYTLIGIFLYGFIIVISLIGFTNIFNTITTNMHLRRQEFAMLKSVGMTKKEFNRMIRLESLFMGLKSLLIGVPIGIALSYLIYTSLVGNSGLQYKLPITSIIISIVTVLILISILMKYSINKINKQNTIETIRNENI